ncbi:MAG: DUF1643 domain-containing protein [Cyanobacteria bacterium K_DeepCast_150m_m2_101]|nr:DUF1643 domain-containing protein [Cyanobacteria bacterium K_DeepCast_150m_m2_101]
MLCQGWGMALLREAAFSPDRRHRWWLQRCWSAEQPQLLFIGLNPSRADAERDDPTLRRLIGFARAWGFGSLMVVNLFARCSASPAVLRRSSDPVGADNDHWLQRSAAAASALWLGWGNGGGWRQRDQEVLALLAAALPPGVPLLAVGLTASGQPRHPLYVPAAAQPLRLQHPGAVRPLAACR